MRGGRRVKGREEKEGDGGEGGEGGEVKLGLLLVIVSLLGNIYVI